MALTTSLISFWELGEASGTRNDSHGTNHLTAGNAPTQVAGKVGNAVQFTSASFQSLVLTSNASIQCGDVSFTFAGWFYADTLAGTYLVSKDDATNRDYYIYADASVVQFSVFIAGPTNKAANVSGSYSTATWYFIAAWHDAAADTIYCQVNNGTAASTATTASLQAATTVDFRIGARSSGTDYADGRVDQLGFWKRTLTDAERIWLYNGGAGRSYANIVAESATSTEILGAQILM